MAETLQPRAHEAHAEVARGWHAELQGYLQGSCTPDAGLTQSQDRLLFLLQYRSLSNSEY